MLAGTLLVLTSCSAGPVVYSPPPAQYPAAQMRALKHLGRTAIEPCDPVTFGRGADSGPAQAEQFQGNVTERGATWNYGITTGRICGEPGVFNRLPPRLLLGHPAQQPPQQVIVVPQPPPQRAIIVPRPLPYRYHYYGWGY